MQQGQKKLIVMAAALSLLAACGSNGGGGNGGGGGGARISGAGSNTLTGQAAIFSASESQRGDNGPVRGLSADVTRMASAAVDQKSSGPNETQKAVQQKSKSASDKLNSAIAKGQCQRKFNWDPVTGKVSGSAAAMKPFTLSIKGASCPVEIEFKMVMSAMGGEPCKDEEKGTRCKFDNSVKLSYQVRDEKLASELGVRSGSLMIDMKMDDLMPGGGSSSGSGMPSMGMTSKRDLKVDIKAIDLAGKALLVKGTVNVDQKLQFPDMSQGSGDMSMPMLIVGKEEILYSNEADGSNIAFLSTIKADGGSQPEEKYFINGAGVSADDYKTQRELLEVTLGEDMGGSGEDGGKPTPEPMPNPNPNPNPNPYPNPNPNPYPNPNPNPNPYPNPNPNPNPNPAPTGQWFCVTKSYSPHQVFAGYGTSEFMATSKAKQACQSTNASCSGLSMSCDQLEAQQDAWFCETKNYSNGKVFNASGASKLEASYLAVQQCLISSGTNGNCQDHLSATCQHQ